MIDFLLIIAFMRKYHREFTSENILKNYLENKEQRAKVNECEIDWSTVRNGVPERTLLGPLLFLLYMFNDLLKMMPKKSTFFLIISEGKDWMEFKGILNSLLNIFHLASFKLIVT